MILGGGIGLLQNCTGTRYIDAQLSGSELHVPVSAFEVVKNDAASYRKYIIVGHETLQYPICVYRLSDSQFRALLMRCTHQGTELQVFGDRLQCPAHGSEFTNSGAIQNGPAESPLRTFPVRIEHETLKLNLA